MTAAQRALSVTHKEGKQRSSLNKTFLKKDCRILRTKPKRIEENNKGGRQWWVPYFRLYNISYFTRRGLETRKSFLLFMRIEWQEWISKEVFSFPRKAHYKQRWAAILKNVSFKAIQIRNFWEKNRIKRYNFFSQNFCHRWSDTNF